MKEKSPLEKINMIKSFLKSMGLKNATIKYLPNKDEKRNIIIIEGELT